MVARCFGGTVAADMPLVRSSLVFHPEIVRMTSGRAQEAGLEIPPLFVLSQRHKH